MTERTQKADYNATYVSTNIRPGAPEYSAELVAKYRSQLLKLGHDWDDYSYAVLGDFNAEEMYIAGRDIHLRTYAKVQNPEVRELLSISLPEFRDATTAVVWGFNIAGANNSGLFHDYQTEMIVAAAIHSEGASRQARSHVKASLAMGNSLEAVKSMINIGADFADWTGAPLPHTIDVDGLKEQVDKA